MSDSISSYSRKYLCRDRRKYKSTAKKVAFLLGGIGTGNVSVGSRGQLRDWEIFNKPDKGRWLPYTFFAIWIKNKKEKIARVLESEIEPLDDAYCHIPAHMADRVAGLPRFVSSTLKAQYPFVWIDFKSPELPVKVSMEAFTPFIPLNANDSGLPGAIIRYKVINRTSNKIEVSVVGSLSNVIGFKGFNNQSDIIFRDNKNAETVNKSIIEYREKNKIKGLYYYSTKYSPYNLEYGNMSLIATGDNITVKPNWYKGFWYDGIQNFWNDFISDGKLNNKEDYSSIVPSIQLKSIKVGSIGEYSTIEPGQSKTFEFLLTWYFPNRPANWDENYIQCNGDILTIKNYYATLFKNSWEVTYYLKSNLSRLEKDSKAFRDALYNSTLPACVIDLLAAGITVLRSNTCFRLEDGTFLGWEGITDKEGFCPGTCTHVWNYAQTVAFLFPDLEKTAREVEFLLETDKNGKMNFRAFKVFGEKSCNNPEFASLPPSADGQLGTIIRFYREWKLSGDDRFLKRLWPKVKLAMDFAIAYLDTDGDYIQDGSQHVTYDIDFFGQNSMVSSLYFAALKVSAEIADYLEDTGSVKKYEALFQKGSKAMDKLLWNGNYYIQKIEDVNKYHYQYGEGCLSDQLFGQTLAHLTGIGYILPREHVKKAIKSVFDFNFKTNFRGFSNVQRVFAVNDEAGLLLCTWPEGGRPEFPFIYSDEVWPGIECQVATHLIYEGYIDEGLAVVKAVRDRHDGYRRNPFDEFESCHHYARSMASWGLLIALSGFKYDMVKGEISFNPKINQGDFSCFFSTGKGWGIYRQKKDLKTGKLKKELKVLYGDLSEIKLR